MADLQVTQEVIVVLNSFHNVDLFQRGYYQVRCHIEEPSKLISTVECEVKEEDNDNRSSPCLFKAFVDKYVNTGVSKTIEVYYKHEQVALKDAFIFKVHMLLDSSKIESVLPTKLQLVLDLYFGESSRSPTTPKCLEHASTQGLTLHLSSGDAYHAYRPILFDYFHLGAVTLSVHSSVVAFRQPWSSPLKSLHPIWSGRSGNARQYSYSALFGKNSSSITPSQKLERKHVDNASTVHRKLCLILLKLYETLLANYHSVLTLIPKYVQMRLSKVDVEAKLEVLNNELNNLATAEEVYMRMGDDLYLLSTELNMLWMQFTEQFVYENVLTKYLVEEHHTLRTEHMKEAVFTQEHPWEALCSSLEISTSQQARMFSDIKGSLYYQLIPPINIECALLDGDCSTMPIIFEDKYVPGRTAADKDVNGDVLQVKESIVGEDFVDMDVSIQDATGRITKLSISDNDHDSTDRNITTKKCRTKPTSTKESVKHGRTQAWELSKHTIKSSTETDLTGPDYCSACPADTDDVECEFDDDDDEDSQSSIECKSDDIDFQIEGRNNDLQIGGTNNDLHSGGKNNDLHIKGRNNDLQIGGTNNDLHHIEGTNNDLHIEGTNNDLHIEGTNNDLKAEGSNNMKCIREANSIFYTGGIQEDKVSVGEEALLVEDLDGEDETVITKKESVENVIGGTSSPVRSARPRLWSCFPTKEGSMKQSPYKALPNNSLPYLPHPRKLSTRFQRAKENLQINSGCPSHNYKLCETELYVKPYFLDRITSSTENVHLVVCVHGLDGNSGDLRLVRCFLELCLPLTNFDFLMSEINQEDTFCDIDEMTQRLVDEILDYIDEQGLDVVRLSFVGHSLGNIIIRNAVSHSSLYLFRNKLHTFLSLSGPHLGMQFHTSNLVSTGMWLMQKWKKGGSLVQLALNDSTDPRDSFMYRLSLTNGFQYFKNVLLVSSVQDHYVPFHSARVEMSKTVVKDNSEVGRVYKEMLDNIMNPLMAQEEVNIVKYSVHHPMPSSPNTFIGRAAHIAMLDSELFLEKFILTIAHKYFE